MFGPNLWGFYLRQNAACGIHQASLLYVFFFQGYLKLDPSNSWNSISSFLVPDFSLKWNVISSNGQYSLAINGFSLHANRVISLEGLKYFVISSYFFGVQAPLTISYQ